MMSLGYMLILNSVVLVGKSFKYITYKTGLVTKPCGAPAYFFLYWI